MANTIKNPDQRVPKVLWINPVGYDAYDQPMADFVKDIKRPEINVEFVSFDLSPAPVHLEYRTYEALVIGDIIRTTRYAAENDFDAVVIGCFYDPALEAAREISGQAVVVAPCQSSVQIAANLCNKFSIIVGQHKWIEQMTERVNAYGYASRLASMRSIDIAVPDLQKDCRFTEEKIIEAGRKAIEEDHAEALILGCTCTFGLYERVQKELGVPVIDPICAAYKAAEYLAELKQLFTWSNSRAWSMAAPPEEEIRTFGLFADKHPIGNSVVIKASKPFPDAVFNGLS